MVESGREGHYRIRTNPIVRFSRSTPCVDVWRIATVSARHGLALLGFGRSTPCVDACCSANQGWHLPGRWQAPVDPRHAWMPLARTSPAQKSIVADNKTVLGAPSARLESNGMPQYALLVTLFTVARSASGLPASVVL